MTLLEFTIFWHNYGIGVSWDWTLLTHAIIYGGLVFVGAFVSDMIKFPPDYMPTIQTVFGQRTYSSMLAGLLASITAALFVELGQMYQYHWKLPNGDPCGMFGLGDIVVSWGSACLMYKLLRRFN